MANIEAEIRSFITKEQYEQLLKYFNKNAKLKMEDYQETFYFDAKEDLRIQRNNYFAKIWMKKGKIHDEAREEIEIKFDRNKFAKLEQLFTGLGYKIKIKWFRKRHEYDWDGITVDIDYTKGYGYIIELEKLCSAKEKEAALTDLKNRLKKLNIELTPRQEFEKKFTHYEDNWQKLTGES